MIALACDHGGYDLKAAVIEVFNEFGLEYEDFGTDSRESVDYPIYGERAARAVASGRCELGVVLCGTGLGIGMAANKVKGIRCATCSDCFSARMAREHNNANMIAMGSRVTGSELAKEILRAFLKAEFAGMHHTKRVQMLETLDNGGTVQPE